MTTKTPIKPLGKRYEKPPISPRPKSYVPIDGRQYKVTGKDTIANIADRTSFSADDIMVFAFGTTDPREVNWYLRERVGCDKYGPNKKNYAFSDTADPGKIWVPKEAYKQLKEEPKPSVGKSYDVPRLHGCYQQHSDKGCWGATVAKLHDWKHGKPRRRVRDALLEIGWQWAVRYESKLHMKGPMFTDFATDAGLRPLALGRFRSDDEWMRSIRRTGPMLITVATRPGWMHWLIVTGYKMSADGKLEIRVADPFGGQRRYETADELYSKCLDAPTRTSKVWSY